MEDGGLFLEIFRAKAKPADLTSTLLVHGLPYFAHIPYLSFLSFRVIYCIRCTITTTDQSFGRTSLLIILSVLSIVHVSRSRHPLIRSFPQTGVLSSDKSIEKHRRDSTVT